MTTMGDRLNIAIIRLGLNKFSFSKKLGLKQSTTITQIVTGVTKTIKDDVLRKIHHTFPEMNILWLITGEGEVLNQDEKKTTTIKSVDQTIEDKIIYELHLKFNAFYEPFNIRINDFEKRLDSIEERLNKLEGQL